MTDSYPFLEIGAFGVPSDLAEFIRINVRTREGRLLARAVENASTEQLLELDACLAARIAETNTYLGETLAAVAEVFGPS